MLLQCVASFDIQQVVERVSHDFLVYFSWQKHKDMVMIFWLTPNLNRESFFLRLTLCLSLFLKFFHTIIHARVSSKRLPLWQRAWYVRCTGQCKELACFRHKYRRTTLRNQFQKNDLFFIYCPSSKIWI